MITYCDLINVQYQFKKSVITNLSNFIADFHTQNPVSELKIKFCTAEIWYQVTGISGIGSKIGEKLAFKLSQLLVFGNRRNFQSFGAVINGKESNHF